MTRTPSNPDRDAFAASASADGSASGGSARDMTLQCSTLNKLIDPAALGSLSTGVLMTDFSLVHEAAEWLMGHPVWTHEFPALSGNLQSAALAQFPDLPCEIASEGWEATRDAIRARYGESVSVVRGSNVREADPITTAKAALRDAPAGEA